MAGNAYRERTAPTLRQLVQLGRGESLYGIVDGARDLELAYEAKCVYGREIRTLFHGDVAPALAEVAPYLVTFDSQLGYLERWEARRGKNVGILLVARVGTDDLFDHLREIFIACDEEGQQYFFRYYDPRVLRLFLPTCRSSEIDEFFGSGVRRIICDSESGAAFVSYEPLTLEG